VGNQKDGLGGHGLIGPQLQQFTAQVFGGQHVEGAERLVHKENFGFDHQGASKAYPLLHAARQLLRVGAFKAVQSHGVQYFHAAVAAHIGRDAAGLQRGFNVFQHREPGKKSKALKNNSDVDLRVGDRFFVPVNLACRGRGEACQHAQHGRFAGAGGTKQGNDLSGDDGEIGGGDDQDAALVGLRVVLLDLLGANDCLDGRDWDRGRRRGLACAGDGRFLHG
jgi:hypothetical protein